MFMQTGESFIISCLASVLFSLHIRYRFHLISVITENRTFVSLLLLSHTVHFLERILKAFVILYFSAQLFIALLLCASISDFFHIYSIFSFM